MASIASMGVGSGMDIAGLVQKLVAAERQPAEQRLIRRETNLSVQLSALGSLKGAMADFQSALSSLKDISAFNKRTATSGNTDLYTVSAGSNAVAGNYEVEVIATAQSHKIASDPFTAATDVVGTGTLTFQFGDPTKPAQTVAIDAAHSSLEGIRNAVNAANIGVRASIVNGDDGYQLVFASQNTGLDNALKVSVADDDGGDTDTTGLSQLAFNASAGNMTQIVAAEDAEIKVDGIKVTSSNNTFANVVDGVTVTAKKAEPGAKSKMSIALDTASTSTAVENFVSAYNELMGTINSIAGYDAETKQAGPMVGDAGIRGITMQLRQMLGGVIPGGEFKTLADLGIKTQRDGTLSLDKTVLGKALSSNYDDVGRLFAAGAKVSDPQVRFVSAGDKTQPGDYALNITQLATHGVYTGNAPVTTTVGDTNDTLRIKVDGVSSSVITLAQGDYTGEALASELQSRINGDSALKEAGVSVSVEFDGSRFILTSDRYGSGSSVEILGGNTADFGLPAGAGTTGLDVAGTINGVEALGTGQTLTSSGGLKVEVTGGDTGDRGSVLFSHGIAAQVDSLLTRMLDDKGLLSSRSKGLDNQVKDVMTQRETLERRMQMVEQRYIAQFTAMDTMIAKLNSTGSYLNQQLASLAKLGSNSK
ncbi:MAG: flagellar filament capping protein FliD [Gammaproteobacteria bacterium]|nr:flagellar filament capping protein FliD [Gammaproteobacteria bacterium]